MVFFPIMEPSFCFAHTSVKFIAIPATSLVDNLGNSGNWAVLVWKEGFDAARFLKNDLKVDKRVEFVNAGRFVTTLLLRPK